MELDVKPKIKSGYSVTENGGSDQDIAINLYKTPPFGRLTLDECEDLFRQRLEALMLFDKNRDVPTNLLKGIKSHVFKSNCISLRLYDKQQHKWDHFSHMLMRMYCIYNSNLWQWFKQCEKRLLMSRLRDQAGATGCLSGSNLDSILRNFNFDFQRISNDELNDLYREDLIGWNNIDHNTNHDIFKVKFVDALHFIAKRSVSLKDGFAFLTRREIVSVVCDVFGKHLDNELKFARQHLNTELIETRQLLDSLNTVYSEYKKELEEEQMRAKRAQDGQQQNPYRIDTSQLDEISKQHYPPCMRYLHDSLLEDHHLKHNGRLYYGTFLRSGGVDMDSAIEFWRKEFTKSIPNDKFERDYKYNIRHLYGREGHKKALSCFSCDKIINDNAPGVTDKHGCPFKHFDDKHLKALLTKHGLKDLDIESMLMERKSRDNPSKTLCGQYFNHLKGTLPSEPIKNPIHYYYESRRHAYRLLRENEDCNDPPDEEELNWEPLD